MTVTVTQLFPISKEHQITTGWGIYLIDMYCFPFQKSIKSQQELLRHTGLTTVSHFKRASNHNPCAASVAARSTVSHFKRASNHNTPRSPSSSPSTVSHFKRASNHNDFLDLLGERVTVSHFKRASNHNRSARVRVNDALFPISKEHQITTICAPSNDVL